MTNSRTKRGALLVNPYNFEQVADTILKAFQMNRRERKASMERMRHSVSKENVFWWVDSFLKAGLLAAPLIRN